MPQYCYKCPRCKNEITIIKPMKDSGLEHDCDWCGERLERDMAAERPNVRGKDYVNPLLSDSLAIHPEQIAEHKQYFPDVEVESDGRLRFDNSAQHDRYLKKSGYYKAPQRIRRKGRTIKLGDLPSRKKAGVLPTP